MESRFEISKEPSVEDMKQLHEEFGIDVSVFEGDFLTDDEDSFTESIDRKAETPSFESKYEAVLKKKDDEIHDLKNLLTMASGKMKLCKSTADKSYEEQQSKIRVMKSDFEAKLSGKEKLVCSLQDVLNKLNLTAKGNKKGGKKTGLFINLTKAVNDFVHENEKLQNDKVTVQNELNIMEEKHLKITKELSDLQEIIKESYCPKDECDLLQFEIDSLQKSLKSKEQVINYASTANQRLRKQVETLQNKLSSERTKHFEQLKLLRNENNVTSHKLREVEGKYTTLALTPPKAHFQKVMNLEAEKELAVVKVERQRLANKLNRQQGSLSRELITSEDEIKRLSKKLKMAEAESRDILVENQKLKDSLKESEEIHRYTLIEKEEEFRLKVSELQECETRLRGSMEEKVKEAVLLTERKFETQTTILTRLCANVVDLRCHLESLRKEKDELRCQIYSLMGSIRNSFLQIQAELVGAVSENNRQSQLLVQQYRREMKLRKKFHNELVELRGNIRVFCRVRPIIKEDGKDWKNVVSFLPDDDSLLFVNNKSGKKTFTVDKVFGPATQQTEIFEGVKPLVASCLDGYNVCIFAYGQTGSGKTYTMEGTEEHPGINQQALQLLFEETALQADWCYTVLVSFMEVYNDQLRDLLSVNSTVKLDIRNGNKDGHYIPDLTQVEVKSARDVNEVFFCGRKKRATASTNMNEQSSRSHSILVVSVVGENKNTGTKFTGKMNLVDLAGSERISKSGSEGLRMVEAKSINKSLSALSDVIHSLKNKSSHVPYRNSKLTYLLRDSLGGDSKTLMVVQISPVEKNTSETICSLNFAERVGNVELGRATRKITKT